MWAKEGLQPGMESFSPVCIHTNGKFMSRVYYAVIQSCQHAKRTIECHTTNTKDTHTLRHTADGHNSAGQIPSPFRGISVMVYFLSICTSLSLNDAVLCECACHSFNILNCNIANMAFLRGPNAHNKNRLSVWQKVLTCANADAGPIPRSHSNLMKR